LTLTVVDEDGTPRSRVYHIDDVTLISGEPLFMAELPKITGNSRTVFLQIEGLRHNATINRVELYSMDPSRTTGHNHALLFLTLLIGLMCGPILFDISAGFERRQQTENVVFMEFKLLAQFGDAEFVHIPLEFLEHVEGVGDRLDDVIRLVAPYHVPSHVPIRNRNNKTLLHIFFVPDTVNKKYNLFLFQWLMRNGRLG